MWKLLWQIIDLIVGFAIWMYALYMLWKPNPTIKDLVVLCAILLITVLGNQSKIDTIAEKLK